ALERDGVVAAAGLGGEVGDTAGHRAAAVGDPEGGGVEHPLEAVVAGAEVGDEIEDGPGIDHAVGEQRAVVHVPPPSTAGDGHVHRRRPEAGGARHVREVAQGDALVEGEVDVPPAPAAVDVHPPN